MIGTRTRWLLLVAALITFALACRTLDLVSSFKSAPPPVAARSANAPTRKATQVAKANTARRTPTVMVAATEPPPPTDVPPPTDAPTEPPLPTKRPAAAPPPRPTQPPPPTAVPATAAPQYPYTVKESTCGPNVETFIEGYVYEDGSAKNGMLVRISQGPDGQPDPNQDYRTGTDPSKPGYYIQNVDVHAPHGGLWYLWVIDPANNQRVSTIAIVKTDPKRVEDTDNNPGSCQSATVSFDTAAPVDTGGGDGGGGSQPEPTHDPLDDSSNQ